MEEPRIKIGFTFTDRFNNEYASSSCVEVFDSLGETDLDVIGEQLNTFLSQIGYCRNGDCVLMEGLTEEERDALLDYLSYLRDDDLDVSINVCSKTETNTSGCIQNNEESEVENDE